MATPSTSSFVCFSCENGLPDVHRSVEAEEAADYIRGEVFSIEESVYTPIEHIFADPNVSGLAGANLNHSTASLNKLCTRNQATNKTPRPCILAGSFPNTKLEDIKNPSIWLMATFEGTPMSTLPPIYQFFCIAVHPTPPLCPLEASRAISLPSPGFHLHSLPEWPTPGPNSSQWIIAWEFETTRPLLGRWLTPQARKKARLSSCGSTEEAARVENSHRGERIGMTFGPRATMLLRAQTAEHRNAWIQLCKTDKQFALARQKEFQEWRSAGGRRRSMCGSKVSCTTGSQKEGHCKARSSYVGHSILNETIHEDGASVYPGRQSSMSGKHSTLQDKSGKEGKPRNCRHNDTQTASNAPCPGHAVKQHPRSDRKSVKSAAGASIASSHNSVLPRKVFSQISNRFAALGSLRMSSTGDS
ncbi:hypothetical protein C8Q70DRAFT_1036629 [Cubamyces menziesii]|nr:hypothetical protein C8Q70DRAFT_1036629 [Cubamyces menziesii]